MGTYRGRFRALHLAKREEFCERLWPQLLWMNLWQEAGREGGKKREFIGREGTNFAGELWWEVNAEDGAKQEERMQLFAIFRRLLNHPQNTTTTSLQLFKAALLSSF